MVTFNGKQYATWAEARADIATAAAEPAVAVAEPVAEPVAFKLTAAPEANRPAQSLAARYRPRRLAGLAGQAEVVDILRTFLADPYPTAFILAGDTGTGKTSAAWALAGELGCNIDSEPPEFGGVHSIPSGELNTATVRTVWGGLWQTPFDSARGWKVLIVNEIENLRENVELLFLDRLEDIPPSTVVVFTTNALASLPPRFVDRCIGGVLEFRASADDLAEPARGLARSIWQAETGGNIPPDVLEKVIQRSTSAGRLSFRRVVQNLTPLIGRK